MRLANQRIYVDVSVGDFFGPSLTQRVYHGSEEPQDVIRAGSTGGVAATPGRRA